MPARQVPQNPAAYAQLSAAPVAGTVPVVSQFANSRKCIISSEDVVQHRNSLMDAYGFEDLQRPCPLTRTVHPTFEATIVLLVSILLCCRRWTLLASWTRVAASNDPEQMSWVESPVMCAFECVSCVRVFSPKVVHLASFTIGQIDVRCSR